MFFHDVVNIEQRYWKRIAPRRTIARVSSRVRFCKLTPSPTRHSDLIYVEKVIYVRPSSYCLDTEDLKCVFSSKKKKKNFIVPKGLRRPMRLVLAASRDHVNRESIRKRQLLG